MSKTCRKDQNHHQPERTSEKKKAVHSATTNTKSKLVFGAIAALGVIFAKTLADQAYRDAAK